MTSPNATPSLLSADITIRGDLVAKGEVQIDGIIDGEVNCGKLIVGERATINGGIKADSVLVRGKVAGTINAKQVELMRSARVQGDILHETMAIEAGAYLEGMCKRIDNREAAQDANDHTATESDIEDGQEDADRPAFTGRRNPRSAGFGGNGKQPASSSGS